jgi:hypothetical protein
MANGDALRLEQYMDFASARTYRNSLWIHAAQVAALPSALVQWPVTRLSGLQVAANLQTGSNAPAQQVAYLCATGQGFSADAVHAPMLDALLRSPGGPLWRSADELLAAHPQSSALLLECVLHGLLSAWKQPSESLQQLQALQAPKWLLSDAARQDSQYLPSVWQAPVGVDAATRALIGLLDGSRSLAQLQQAMQPVLAQQGPSAEADQHNWLQTGLQRLQQLGWLAF